MDTPALVSVIMPCRNEERHIQKAITSILGQQGNGKAFTMEILIIDGMSTDSTPQILWALAETYHSIRIIKNEKRITPVAFNLGIMNATGRYICILGSHAEIEDDYIVSCLEVMHQTDADNVGGPWKAVGIGFMGEAIALAFQNPVAIGAAKGHDLLHEGPVDTVWGGFYKREVFETCGYFDEEFIRNQDDELNLRLVKKGLRIYQSPKIRYKYYCRESLRKLFKQYLQYGYWKIRVMKKHRTIPKVRHIVPVTFLLSILVTLGLGTIHSIFWLLCLFILGAYVTVIFAASTIACFPQPNRKYLVIMPFILITYHISYGVGEVAGAFGLLIPSRRRSGPSVFDSVSR